MQQLGKIADPVSNEIVKDLDQAKFSIDILDALKEKTQGNLTDPEREFLDKILFELHMNYVDEVNISESESATKDDAAAEENVEPDEQTGGAEGSEESAEEGDRS